MKLFTRLCLVAALGTIANVSMAQYDLKVTSVTTVATSTGQVPPNTAMILSIGIENVGADIPDQTTFSVIALNGTDTISVNNNWFFNGTYPNGTTGTVESNAFTLPAAPPNVTLCGAVVLHVPDSDSSNNYHCEPFVVSSSADPDIRALRVFINDPTDLDSFDIDNGDNEPDPITDVHVEFKNVGNCIYPAGFGIPYTYEFDGASEGYVGTLAEDMNPGDTTTRPSVDPSFDVPVEEGTWTMCVYTTLDNGNASNDTVCTSFTLIDTYVPPPPIGIEDGPQSLVNVYAHNNVIMVKDVAQPLEISVIDAQGRVVHESLIESDRNIQLETAAGVYVVRTRNITDGKSTMQKVILQ